MPTPEFRARMEQVVAADGWVIDSLYQQKLDELVPLAADTIVWLDLPLHVTMGRLARRTATRYVRRTELWNGNRETLRSVLWGRDSLFALGDRPPPRVPADAARGVRPARLPGQGRDPPALRPRRRARWLDRVSRVSGGRRARAARAAAATRSSAWSSRARQSSYSASPRSHSASASSSDVCPSSSRRTISSSSSRACSNVGSCARSLRSPPRRARPAGRGPAARRSARPAAASAESRTTAPVLVLARSHSRAPASPPGRAAAAGRAPPSRRVRSRSSRAAGQRSRRSRCSTSVCRRMAIQRRRIGEGRAGRPASLSRSPGTRRRRPPARGRAAVQQRRRAPPASAAWSGTISFAARLGVPARTSAARSTSGTSCSWPIAETTGVAHPATARTSRSSENGSRSSKLPPPRASTITSTCGSRSSSLQRPRRSGPTAGRALHGRLDGSETGPAGSAAAAVSIDVPLGRGVAAADQADRPAGGRAAAACAPSAKSPSAASRVRSSSIPRSSWPSPKRSSVEHLERGTRRACGRAGRGRGRAPARPPRAAASIGVEPRRGR